MRKRPEIPEDVFFDTGPTDDQPEPEPEVEEGAAEETRSESAGAAESRDDEVLAKSMDARSEDGASGADDAEVDAQGRSQKSDRKRESQGESETDQPRVGRPPAQEGPKVAVTLYLTEPVAHLLEEVKFRLLTEYDVKTSKSAIADFAMRNGLEDLQAAADDLRRD